MIEKYVLIVLAVLLISKCTEPVETPPPPPPDWNIEYYDNDDDFNPKVTV